MRLSRSEATRQDIRELWRLQMSERRRQDRLCSLAPPEADRVLARRVVTLPGEAIRIENPLSYNKAVAAEGAPIAHRGDMQGSHIVLTPATEPDPLSEHLL